MPRATTNPGARRRLSWRVAVVLCAVLATVASLTTSEPVRARPLGDDAKTTVEGAPVVPGVRDRQPRVDVVVEVGALSQRLLDSHPEGTRFGIAGGVHRVTQALRPRSGQQLIGFPGAVLSGAKPLSGWIRQGARWYVSGQTQQLPVTPAPAGETVCRAETPLCNRGHDVFVDGVALRPVGSLGQLTAGTYHFDEDADRIYVGRDPRGSLVETTVTPFAIRGGGRDVVISDLVVEKFGNPAQQAAVHDGWQPGWRVEHNEIRLNHSIGVQLHGGVLRANVISSNGQLGVGGGGVGLLVEGNEIASNNAYGYNPYWEAGGTKWVAATDLTVRGNWAHDNAGPGLATDLDNRGVLYEGNVAEDNDLVGIFHELSHDATIRDNVSRGNGRRVGWYPEGAGILVYNSRGVTVSGNVVSGNAGGIVVRNTSTRPYPVRDVTVVDNTISLTEGRSGLVDDSTGTGAFDSISFVANRYVVPSTNIRWFEWNDGMGMTFARWQAMGQDVEGRMVHSIEELAQPPSDPGSGTGGRTLLYDTFAGPDGSYWSDTVWADVAGLAGSVHDLRGGQGRITTGTLVPYAGALAEPLGGSRTDGDVYVVITRVDGASEAYVDVWQRASDNGGGHPTDGYKVETSWDGTSGDGRMMLFEVSDGAATWLGTLRTRPRVGEPVILRFRTLGTTIAAKTWAPGTREPGTWDVQVTDRSHAEGTRRLRVMSGAVPHDVDVRFDDFIDWPL